MTITTNNIINMEKRIMKNPEKISYQIMQTKPKKGWKETTEKIKITAGDGGTISKRSIIKKFQEKITQSTANKTKTKYLTENRNWEAAKRPEYINKLNRIEASIIFKTRTRMLDIKHNYRGKYPDTTCRKCKNEEETQEHILEQCKQLHKNNETKITKTDIFETDPIKLKTTAERIVTLIEKLTSQESREETNGVNE